MSDFFIAPIVEGHGEVQAVPILLQRLLQATRSDASLQVNPPLRVKAASFTRDQDYFARYVELAARKARGHRNGSIIILLDCEDECPARLGPALSQDALAVARDVPIVVALAHREYETWFLSAAHSLRGVCGLPADLTPPIAPESIRDAKGWLSERMSAPYNEPIDQPSLTQSFSFEEAERIASFARLRRKMHSLFAPSP